MAFETFKKFAAERETRIMSPEFQDEIEREKAEFYEQLASARDESTNFLYDGIIKKVLWGTVSEEARSMFSDKYKMADTFLHTTERVADASFSGLKAVGKIALATGKAAKIGARYLIGK